MAWKAPQHQLPPKKSSEPELRKQAHIASGNPMKRLGETHDIAGTTKLGGMIMSLGVLSRRRGEQQELHEHEPSSSPITAFSTITVIVTSFIFFIFAQTPITTSTSNITANSANHDKSLGAVSNPTKTTMFHFNMVESFSTQGLHIQYLRRLWLFGTCGTKNQDESLTQAYPRSF